MYVILVAILILVVLWFVFIKWRWFLGRTSTPSALDPLDEAVRKDKANGDETDGTRLEPPDAPSP